MNNNATREARKLLHYLYSIGGGKILAGHHIYVGRPDIFLDRVKELAGKSPEIWGCDFISYYRQGYAQQLVVKLTTNTKRDTSSLGCGMRGDRKTIRRSDGKKVSSVK